MKFLILFILGTILGSSAECYAMRQINNHSLVKRSFCDNCHKTLMLWQLIPIIGFIVQFGRCYYCIRPINIRSTLIELIFGSYIAFLFLCSPILITIKYLVFFGWLLFLALEDFYLTSVNVFTFFIGYFVILILNFNTIKINLLLFPFENLYFYIIFILLSYFKKLGWADTWLFILIGCYFGFYFLIFTIFFSCLFILVFYIFNKNSDQEFAFIPWILLGILFCFILNHIYIYFWI